MAQRLKYTLAPDEGREIDLEPPERELLERIKRLAAAARERQRRGRLSSLDRPRRHPTS